MACGALQGAGHESGVTLLRMSGSEFSKPPILFRPWRPGRPCFEPGAAGSVAVAFPAAPAGNGARAWGGDVEGLRGDLDWVNWMYPALT